MKTQKISKVAAVFLAVLLLFSLGTTVFADEAPGLSSGTSAAETTENDGTQSPDGTPAPETSEPESAETPEAEATPETDGTPAPSASPEADGTSAPSAAPEASPSASPAPEASGENSSEEVSTDAEAGAAAARKTAKAAPLAGIDFPEETCTVDYSKRQSDGVTYDGYKIDGDVCKVYYTIHEDAGDSPVIELSKGMLAFFENESIMPGDAYKFQIILQNESGNTYRYKNNSFVLAPGDTEEYGSLSEGSMLPVLTYDGQLMPIRMAGAVLPYYFYEDVFGVSSSSKVTFEMMCQIYDYLADAGYEGNTAITDYMLAYYNNKRGTSYDNLTDLFADHPNWLDGDLVTKNGIWTMSEDELTGYIEKYPWIDSFVYATQSGDNLNIQIKWPEPELAAVSYNSLYMGLFSVVYGEENVNALNPNGAGVEFSRAHAVGDYLPDTGLYQETNQYFESLISDSFETGDTVEIPSGFGIDGPGMGDSYQNYSFSYYNIIELEQIKPIEISLSDITIYTGGSSYEGVVDGQEGESSTENGFPEPGFYFTLPQELNDKLGQITNLESILTLKYDDGKGTTREWKLDSYGTPEHSSDKVGYMYKFVPVMEGQDPVRVQIQDENGSYIVSDDFEVKMDEQFKQFSMNLYQGSLSAEYVTAEIKIGDKVYTYPVSQSEDATLTVKANINEKHAEVVENRDEIKPGDFAAVADAGTTYFVNDKDVQLEDTSGVRLMVDELIDQDILVHYIQEERADELPDGNVKFQQRYFDLVDINNGDAYLTLGDGCAVTVYWPVPADYDNSKEACIYHFDGVDRDYNNGDVVAQIEELITIKPELVTVNGTDYFEFTTASFSPFVLAYAVETEEPEPSTEPSPSPTTEPTPAPTTEPTAEPTPAPTAEPTAAVTPTPAPEATPAPAATPTPQPEKPAVDTPQTGDSTNPAMWVVILCIGAACLTLSLVYFRMQKKASHRK